MATIVLSAAGMALGGSVGGSVLGLSMATIGRAAGATVGNIIDQRVLGAGSEPVEVGRVDRFRVSSASEGAAVPMVFGRMRVPGQVIWATQFQEVETTTGGGKGAGPQPKTTEYSYTVSLALALCEGEITRVGRVWADGVEVSPLALNMRVYTGDADQMPDPKITAVEGTAYAPAYRGVAYVVLEDLELEQFGNRVPQLTFEVMRPSAADEPAETKDIARQVRAVAMIPGTGEYSLATDPVFIEAEFGEQVAINENTPSGQSDFKTSVAALTGELPRCGSVSLVVSWFGSDLRCASCEVAPKVEQYEADAEMMPWSVASVARAGVGQVPFIDGRPVYGGTPSDAAVIDAIKHLNAKQQRPVFYPFILMEQLNNNGLPDPWSNSADQPKLPWRGRITTTKAPGQSGSPDGTSSASDEVAAFMGTAQPSDFAVVDGQVNYTGPAEWRYRRFILHYAHLCVAAGGVSAFCIGSEMVALTQIRGAGNSFPAVAALQQLAAECKTILGPECKISYAADWSEYHGYQPVGTNDKFFHLDPLWADPNIDFIGVDNYMPLSDWRDEDDHLDASWGSIYNLDYLEANVAGGEGFDWFYHSPEARDAQIRTPIIDGDDEPWVWRYKDLKGWWENTHHNRIGGQRQSAPSAWIPESKPFWFTEFGCAAIDKGTNQPNKFLDPKSSESFLPFYSNGMRDEFMQVQYLRATYAHYAKPSNNPLATNLFDGRMVDMTRAHVWAWDARPFPFFPANDALWSDGDNYSRGHWLNGRSSSRTLASIVAEVCIRAGITRYDVSELYGLARGYVVSQMGSGRAALQPLLLAFGIEAVEREGTLVFFNRDGKTDHTIMDGALALNPETDLSLTQLRSSKIEIAGRVQVGFLDADGDYEVKVSETIDPRDTTLTVSRTEFPLAMTKAEGARTVSRWLSEAQVAQDSLNVTLPPSLSEIVAGDVLDINQDGAIGKFRIDRIEESGLRLAEATRVDPEIYKPQAQVEEGARLKPFVAPTPAEAVFLDLPLMTGDEVPHEPHLALTARPWPGSIALYSSPQDSGYVLQDVFRNRSILGKTQTGLPAGPLGIWDRQTLRIRLVSGSLQSVTPETLFSGANTLVIGDGTPDNWEVLQFADVQPVAPRTFEISQLLRGQAGSDGLMPNTWPIGSIVVVMDGKPEQITIPTASRGNPRHYRYGPVKRPYSDRSYRHKELTFLGNGARPYPVAHIRVDPDGAAYDVGWIRRTRIDGDLWGRSDVPLGEERERYLVQVRQGATILREETLNSPSWRYTAAQVAADVGNASFDIAVAQLSDSYGPGPFKTVTVT